MRPAWKGSAERVAERRPERVIASAYRTSNATTRVLSFPKDASFHLTAAANIIAHEFDRRAKNERWSITYALGSATITGPWLQRKLAEGHIHVTERTAFTYVQDLVEANALQLVGQLPGRLRDHDGDGDFSWARGANVYSLPAFAQTVLKLGRDLFGRLRLPRRSSADNAFQCSRRFTETDVGKELKGRLRGRFGTHLRGAETGLGGGLPAPFAKRDWIRARLRTVFPATRSPWAIGSTRRPTPGGRLGGPTGTRELSPTRSWGYDLEGLGSRAA